MIILLTKNDLCKAYETERDPSLHQFKIWNRDIFEQANFIAFLDGFNCKILKDREFGEYGEYAYVDIIDLQKILRSRGMYKVICRNPLQGCVKYHEEDWKKVIVFDGIEIYRRNHR